MQKDASHDSTLRDSHGVLSDATGIFAIPPAARPLLFPLPLTIRPSAIRVLLRPKEWLSRMKHARRHG
jgi:hypothetical protein